MTDEQLQFEAETILYSQDAREAIALARHLSAESGLTDYAQKLLPQLRFIRMASLSEDELTELLKHNLLDAYLIPEFDLAAKIEWYIGQVARTIDQISVAKKVKSLLDNHTTQFGHGKIVIKNQTLSPTIGSWVADYNSYPLKGGEPDVLSELDYIHKSPNLKTLAPEQVEVLKNILKLYDYVTRLISEWDSTPIAQSEAEAFAGFDLYDLIPGLKEEPEEDQLESTTASTTAASKPASLDSLRPQSPPSLPQTAPPAPNPTAEQQHILEDINRTQHRPVTYNSTGSASPTASSTDTARIYQSINHKPTDKRGVTMDPTNIKISEEQQRFTQERARQEKEIQRKLAELRQRNNKS